MSTRQKIIEEIIAREVGPGAADPGGYTNDPDDPGGETRWGVTVAVARASGYGGDMRELPREFAERVYAARYWDAVRADEMAALSARVAEEVVDAGVNCGTVRASTWLQQALNALNNNGRLYPDIIADGKIGPATLAALKSYLMQREARILVRALDCLQGAFYLAGNEKYIYGWLSKRVGV